ncbi:MAG: ComF family protein [Marinilabiliales bacterium]
MLIKNLFLDFANLIYPDICMSCGNNLLSNEQYLCVDCYYDLPRTNFYKDPENPVAKIFWGRAKIEQAFSYFYFSKGSKFQKLIHHIKYQGYKELGYYLGKNFGMEIKDFFPEDYFDYLIPVPLHPKKEKKRGFNQSEWIANGIGEALNVNVDSKSLIRNVYTETQTKKSRIERWKNVESIFQLKNPEKFNKKHIVIIDDVITTGSTIEACIETINNACNARISVMTLACVG